MAAARFRITGGAIAAWRRTLKRPPLEEMMRNNMFFDTCVYHLPGIESADQGDPGRQHPVRLGNGRRREGHRSAHRLHHYDDTKRYIDQVSWLSAEDKHKIFEGNARKVYSRLKTKAPAQAAV